VDDPAAIQELQKAAPRRRGNNNGNGYGRNNNGPAPITPQIYVPTFKKPTVNEPSPSPEEPMDDITDAAPPPPAVCRISLTEDFANSDYFNSLPSLLQSCRGDSPVEITVRTTQGRRVWRIPSLTVSHAHVVKHLRILPGVTVEE